MVRKTLIDYAREHSTETQKELIDCIADASHLPELADLHFVPSDGHAYCYQRKTFLPKLMGLDDYEQP